MVGKKAEQRREAVEDDWADRALAQIGECLEENPSSNWVKPSETRTLDSAIRDRLLGKIKLSKTARKKMFEAVGGNKDLLDLVDQFVLMVLVLMNKNRLEHGIEGGDYEDIFSPMNLLKIRILFEGFKSCSKEHFAWRVLSHCLNNCTYGEFGGVYLHYVAVEPKLRHNFASACSIFFQYIHL